MINTWLVLLSPLVILIMSLITKRLNISLIFGLITGALVASNFEPLTSATLLTQRLYNQLIDIDNLYLFAFLFILGILISLFEYTGAAHAFAQKLTHHLRSAKNTQKTSLLLSTSLFIDDYLSCLTVGYVMRPITDRFHIPRVKLAYLVHSLSGPLVILVPLSSWVALITNQLEIAGINPIQSALTKIISDPFYIYLQSIPFIFYSLILIVSVWFVVLKNISYGPMHTQEEIAEKTGNLFGGKKSLVDEIYQVKKGSVWNLIIPILIFITSFIVGILWTGGYQLFGGPYSFLQALQKNTQISFTLFIASIIALSANIVMCIVQKQCTRSALKKVSLNGIQMMASSVFLVYLASTLGIMLRADLQIGTYLAQLLLGTLPLFLLPLLFYIIAIITSLITGSAWGTIALLVPIAVQMTIVLLNVAIPTTVSQITILFPILGAIFSGSVCGNHISPIAETTIMSANSSGCYPLDHAYTQFWYVVPVILSAGVSFFLAGLLYQHSQIDMLLLPLIAGLLICLCTLMVANRIFKNTSQNN